LQEADPQCGSDSLALARVSMQTIVAAIRQYLETHPKASDTIDGVSRWWLPAQNVVASPDGVRAALEWLVEAGEVAKRRMPNGQTVYAVERGDPPATGDQGHT
jgi:hypothetical protein